MDVGAAARILWDFHCVYDALQRSDVIIGLGSYDIRVAIRCAQLLQDGLADRIIFTGASGNWTRDLFPNGEAEAFKQRATEDGVPESAILLEPRATNIGENIRFSAELVPTAKQVIFVTKPQTQLRCKATAQQQWSGVTALVTAPETPCDAQPLAHHDEHALICEMVGDFQRMNDYARLGFQTEVEVAGHVRRAFETLVSAGFVDHLQRRPLGK